MRKLKNILVALLVVLALLAGGAGGYLWYSTKQQVEQIVAMARPFADISYGDIEISPAGSLGVNRIRIAPNMISEIFSIGAIRLNAPNILALLKARWQLSQGQLPEALSLSLHEFEIPLDSGLAGAAEDTVRPRTPFDDLEALGCGSVTHFGAADWQGMGYKDIVGNMEIGYRLDAARNLLTLQVDSSGRDWVTVNLDIGLTVSAASIMELATALTPKLASLNLVVRDNGFNQRRNSYCATKAGKSIDDYLANHTRLVVERLRANGVHPGPGLIDAYRRYLSENSQITLVAAPPTPINLAELKDYKPEDVVKLLGLSLKANETAITDLSLNWDMAQVGRALGAAPRPKESEEAAKPAVIEQQATMIRLDYHPTPVEKLGQYIGKNAKLQTSSGVQYRCRLDAIDGESVRVTIRKASGSATLSLRLKDITSAQVLY